ncbi:MAG: RDD family protein [Acidimicrobiia bacterium]
MTDRNLDSPITEDEIAGFPQRVLGFLADQALLVIITLILARFLDIEITEDDALRLPVDLLITRAIASAVYYIAFTTSRGQTPGKMLAGTRVVMERTGLIPGIGPSALRWAVPGIPEAPQGISVIGLFVRAWTLVDDRNRGLHDKAAKTVVIRLDRLTEEPYSKPAEKEDRGGPPA